MMLLDGYQNIKRYGSIQAPERGTKYEYQNVIDGLKTIVKHDLTTCLNRMVATIKHSAIQHDITSISSQLRKSAAVGGNAHNRKDSDGTKDYGTPAAVAASANNNNNTKTSSTLNRILNDQISSSHIQRIRGSVDTQRQQWIPSVKGNLSRSFSVQQRKIVDTTKLKLKYQYSINETNSSNSEQKRRTINRTSSQKWISQHHKSSSGSTYKSAATAKRSDQISWSPFSINKFSVALLPIILGLLLASDSIHQLHVNCAPLPPQYGDRAILPDWLGEGLINLDFNRDESIEQPSFFTQDDNDNGDDDNDSFLEQTLLNALTERYKQEQQSEEQKSLGRRKPMKPSWSPFGGEVLEDPSSSSSGDQQASAEQLWVQRRRLDKNRALEPPPWLREQPMRRGYNPTGVSPSAAVDNNNDAVETSQPVDSATTTTNSIDEKLIPGRKSRQSSSSDKLYDEVLKYLTEEAIQGQDFLNEIYDELDQRSKSSSQSGLLSGSKSTTNDVSSQQQQQLQQKQLLQQQQQQQKMSPNLQGSKLGQIKEEDLSNFDTNQYNDPNSALVVVGDEVSSGDGAGNSNIELASPGTSSHADLKAAFANGLLSEQSSPRESSSSQYHDMMMMLGSQQQKQQQQQLPYAPISAEMYASKLEKNSPYTYETAPKTADIELLQSPTRYLTLSSQEPFHVLEEIDQIDDSQLMSPQQQQQQLQQQSQQTSDNEDDVGDNSSSVSQFSDNPDLLSSFPSSNRRSNADANIADELSLISRIDNSDQLLLEPSKRDPPSKPSSNQMSAASSGSGGTRAKLPQTAAGSSDSLAQLNYPLFYEAGDVVDRAKQWIGRRQQAAIYPTRQAMIVGASRRSSKGEIALHMIESGYLNRQQLVQVETKLKSHLEDMIGLNEGSILDLYPINLQQLLIKLDTNKLSTLQIMDMIQKYDFARGSIILSWPKGDQSNPVPILVAILNQLVRNKAPLIPLMDLTSTMEGEDNTVNNMSADDQRSATINGLQIINGEESKLFGQLETMMEDEATTATNNNNKLRIPFAALTALLGAIYANQQNQQLEQLPTLMPASDDHHPSIQALSQIDQQQQQQLMHGQSLMSGPHVVQLSAILLALVGAFVAVKLVMKGQDSRMLLRRNMSSRSLRSFWSFGSGKDDSMDDGGDSCSQLDEVGGDIRTDDGKVIAASDPLYADKCKSADLASMNRHLATETDSIVADVKTVSDGHEHQKKNLEQLSRRLVRILNGFSHRHCNVDSDLKKSDIEEGSCGDGSSKSDSGLSEDEHQQQQTPYRSSRSYIKSLIEVLSKARPFSSSAVCEQDDQELSAKGNNNNNNQIADAVYQDAVSGAGSCDSSDDGGQLDNGVVLSQMDITAAHLILTYMESHLEDKERLRREWLQLNGAISSSSSSSSSSSNSNSKSGSKANNNNSNNTSSIGSSKISEPILQRMAKVALNEENKLKNRDPTIVAFDRNRVKLNPGQQQQQQQLCKTLGKQLKQRASSSSTSQHQHHQQQPTLPSDYINASFIYDDDPSRPTHIIAQGPLEQTTGHFWQMIWEQGISVIVMLTRLNENSTRQCHCYWPTSSDTITSNGTLLSNHRPVCGPSGNVTASTQSPSQSLDDATTTATATATTSTTPTNGNAKQQSATATTTVSSIAGHTNETTISAARRGSVTSVFNVSSAAAASASASCGSSTAASSTANSRNGQYFDGQKGQPIIGNKDLLSNVISFDVCSVVTVSDSLSSSSSSSSTAAEPVPAVALASDDSFDQENSSGWQQKSSSKSKRKQEASRNKPQQQQQQHHHQQQQQQLQTKVIRFEVHLVSEHVSSNDYLVRNMCLVNRSTGETRTITQFHYLNWPDGGVPDNVKNLLQFRRKVHKSYRNLKSPILVHCSDGAGRSGTYTLIDIILERIRNGAKEIDPMATLVHLREQRVSLCANLSQFEFVLMALAEEIQIILDALPQ